MELSDDELVGLARTAVGALGVSELWEVGAAAVLLAGCDAARQAADGAVYTGTGTDNWFSGGEVMPAPAATASAERWLRDSIWHEVRSNFVYRLPLPDFYRLLLGDEEHRVIRTWTTLAAWHATNRFGPEVIYGPGPHGMIDKLCLRDWACDHGLPCDLAYQGHDALQESSGVFEAFEAAARASVVHDPSESIHRDPASEPDGRIAARLWLRGLRDHAEGA